MPAFSWKGTKKVTVTTGNSKFSLGYKIWKADYVKAYMQCLQAAVDLYFTKTLVQLIDMTASSNLNIV